MVALLEPPKAEVLKYRPEARPGGAPPRRRALAVLLDRDHNKTYEAVVDVSAKRLESWREVPGVQPAILSEEFKLVPELVRADVRWQAAMKRRGITDFNDILVDPWAPGVVPPEFRGTRLIRALSYYKKGSNNIYARPIEGVVALVDMNRRRVIEVVDRGIVAVSPDPGAFDRRSTSPYRQGLKPLAILQPEGPSFELRGREVLWQNWRFRFSVHPREGLVLHQASYEDKGRVRPVLYRASLSEMVVPYGDPDAGWRWRSAFDVGEYGIGKLASPQEPSADAPPNAVFFDAEFADDFGKPVAVSRAVSLYERDGGVLWKHYDVETSSNESRRRRDLVLSFYAVVSNYDYGLKWIFRQDGSLELEADLTGILLAQGAGADELQERGTPFGHLVTTGVVAPHHQHFFSFRLDLDVDGPANSLFETNARSLPAGPDNPNGNAFEMVETPLRDEAAARRDLDLASHRRWFVAGAGSHGPPGRRGAYLLAPGENSTPYARPESPVRRRARVLDHHLWATVFKPGEDHAAGFYPNQGAGGEGLAVWSNGEPLEGRDIVLWYTMGITHTPRPEEWPVMPTARAGFKLLPYGFFARNPALDVAPATP